jgi:hypothetical protein
LRGRIVAGRWERMYKAEMRNRPGIVVVLSLVVMGCSQSAKQQPSATKSPANPTAAAPKTPDVSEEDRSQLVANLDEAIASCRADLDEIIRSRVGLETIEGVVGTASKERAAKIQDAAELGQAAQTKVGKELVKYQVLRDLVVLSAERSKKLADATIDRCREKHFPMYERSYVAEKIGNRADEPAARLALEVSNKVVYGWGQRYDTEWMAKDAHTYRAARVDEIAESLGSQISGGR